MNSVSFHSEQTHFTLSNSNEKQVAQWLDDVCLKEFKQLTELSIVFCSDDYLLKINQDFLQHDYYTDVVTFDYCIGDNISGDVFISVDRIKENAEVHNVSFEEELFRIIIHGTLHLIGYKDKTDVDKQQMTSKEDYYLSLRSS